MSPRRREGCAAMRTRETEPRRRHDVLDGGDHQQGQGGAPRRRLRRLQEVGLHAQPHARHVHGRLHQDRATVLGLRRRPAIHPAGTTAAELPVIPSNHTYSLFHGNHCLRKEPLMQAYKRAMCIIRCGSNHRHIREVFVKFRKVIVKGFKF
jgi:hypothetical protein